MSVCIIIPARLKSTRLPEKVLADIHGKPMIQHVYERAKLVSGVDEVLVAADDRKIESAVKEFGGNCVLTPSNLASGTDRVAHVARKRTETIFVNVQGDEPMLDPVMVAKSVGLVSTFQFVMATAAAPLTNPKMLEDPSVVKVRKDDRGKALAFTRTPDLGKYPPSVWFQHIGLYVYTAGTLMKFTSLPRSKSEIAESLEQLRALDNGIDIGVAIVDKAAVGVDTPEDLEAVRKVISGPLSN